MGSGKIFEFYRFIKSLFWNDYKEEKYEYLDDKKDFLTFCQDEVEEKSFMYGPANTASTINCSGILVPVSFISGSGSLSDFINNTKEN